MSNSEDECDFSNNDSDWKPEASLDRNLKETENGRQRNRCTKVQTPLINETTENITSIKNGDSDKDIRKTTLICSREISYKSKLEKRDIVWKKGNITVNEIQIKLRGNEIISSMS